MGVLISGYPVYQGGAELNVYVNLRDLTQTKVDGLFTLQGFAKVNAKALGSSEYDVRVESLFLQLSGAAVYTDSWAALYTELKRVMTAKGFTCVDA
jgi:hypothetical protein